MFYAYMLSQTAFLSRLRIKCWIILLKNYNVSPYLALRWQQVRCRKTAWFWPFLQLLGRNQVGIQVSVNQTKCLLVTDYGVRLLWHWKSVKRVNCTYRRLGLESVTMVYIYIFSYIFTFHIYCRALWHTINNIMVFF